MRRSGAATVRHTVPREAARGRRRLPAFTIIELLIVVAIILCLLGLIVPYAARAIGMARGVHCMNNLRELGKCLRQYYSDCGGAFPPLRAMGRNERMLNEMAEEAGLTVSETQNAGGYHWSIILWPYHRDMRLYVCPSDPNADARGDLFGDGLKPGSPFIDAPPDSYGLNTLLFRMPAKLREMAGSDDPWPADAFRSEMAWTTLNDQKRIIPRLGSRIVMFCGTRGFTVGHQSNTAWRDTGLAERYEWHPWPGPGAFEDGEGFGSYYLFFDGRVEYRDEFPSRFEWALDLR